MKMKGSLQFSYILIAILLLNSCVAYRSDPSPIDEAVMTGKRVRINAIKGKNLRYSSLIKEGEIYYGIKHSDYEKIEKEEIDLTNIKEVEIFNLEKSIFLSALIAIGIALPVIFIATYNPQIGGFTSPN